MKARISIACCVIAAMLGCGAAPNITNASELISELQRAGVQVDSQGPAPIPTGSHFRFDEGFRIQGPDLFADVLRIEDRRVFDIARSAGRLLMVAEAAAGQPIPERPEVYSRHPFVIVIRQQPEGQTLEKTLAKILPPEKE